MPIHPATPDDFAAVQVLLREAGLPTDDLTPAHLEHFLVARNEALCGVVGLEPCGDVALLRSLAVAPEHRNEGLGARLLHAMERRAHEDGIHTLYLLTTSAADFFRRRGYEQISRDALPDPIQQTDEVTRLCPEHATCMKKSLSLKHDSSGFDSIQ